MEDDLLDGRTPASPFEKACPELCRRGGSNEKGIALVIVLLIVALLTITTFEFIDSAMIYSHMTSNSLNGLQASLLARSGINIGEAVLMHDEDPAVDGFAEEWCPEPLEESCRIDEAFLEIPPNMRLRIEIFDESGKININVTRPRNQHEAEVPDPANPPLFYAWQGVLRRLMEANGIDPETVERLNEYWKLKLEENSEALDAAANTAGAGKGGSPTPNPNPDEEPAEASPQQMTAAQLDALLDFPTLDDANSVLGLPPRQLSRLRDLVTALPQRRFPRVNANTAPREVLDAILGDGSISESIVTQRLEVPLQPADLTQQLAGLDTQDPEYGKVGQMMWTRSYMFRVIASALVNPDPVTGLGGIGRTASMLVRRIPAPARQGSQGTGGHWTLTRLDWQKEGGAKLFVEADSSVPEGGEDEARLF